MSGAPEPPDLVEPNANSARRSLLHIRRIRRGLMARQLAAVDEMNARIEETLNRSQEITTYVKHTEQTRSRLEPTMPDE